MMSEMPTNPPLDLCAKIARLVEERGWNQEDFARNADLNRLTVRSIFQGGRRKLHNATVSACARALGIGVNDLRNLPLERLLPRMHTPVVAQESVRLLYERASQPELISWIERNPERAAQLRPEEIDELLSVQGTGGPLTAFGVAHWVELIERKRRLLEQTAIIAGTEYLELLEQFVGVLYEKVQPYRDRAACGVAESAQVGSATPQAAKNTTHSVLNA
jgi:transcriptional regulator with XRE-family HTH domain